MFFKLELINNDMTEPQFKILISMLHMNIAILMT